MLRAFLTFCTCSMLSFSIFAQEAKQVKQCFEDYKSAILEDRGQQATSYVDSRTIAYYEDMLQKSKYADSLTVVQLGLLDKLMVLSIRHRTPKADLLSFNGTTMLTYAIKEGMVGKSSVANISIAEPEIEGMSAKAKLITGGQETPFDFKFQKEEGSWRLDLTSIFEVSEMAFKQLIINSGEDENMFLLSILETITKKNPAGTIWRSVVQE